MLMSNQVNAFPSKQVSNYLEQRWIMSSLQSLADRQTHGDLRRSIPLVLMTTFFSRFPRTHVFLCFNFQYVRPHKGWERAGMKPRKELLRKKNFQLSVDRNIKHAFYANATHSLPLLHGLPPFIDPRPGLLL